MADALLVQLDIITSEGGLAVWLPSSVVTELERDDWRAEDFTTVECGLLQWASALHRKGKAASRIARRVAIYTKAVGRADDWLQAAAASEAKLAEKVRYVRYVRYVGYVRYVRCYMSCVRYVDR